jgi:hypothetical protein
MGQPEPTYDDQKLDSGMTAAYHVWRENPGVSPAAAISVTSTFDGDPASIAELGFEPYTVFGNQAFADDHGGRLANGPAAHRPGVSVDVVVQLHCHADLLVDHPHDAILQFDVEPPVQLVARGHGDADGGAIDVGWL